MDKATKNYRIEVSDYEHAGDLSRAADVLRENGILVLETQEMEDDGELRGLVTIHCTPREAIRARDLI